MKYSSKFKKRMLAKMMGPGAKSALSLSKEVGIPQPTLSKWLREAKVRPMGESDKKQSSIEKPNKKSKRWTPKEKVRVVMEANAAGEQGLGAILRREGLHEADLQRFRNEVLEAAERGLKETRQKRGLSAEEKENRALRKELKRKEKALAETAALLVLRGKVQAFLAEEEEGYTKKKRGK